jgi:hypothetical protein
MVSSIDETIDRLYSLDPDEFTKERNEAAKQLRADGDRAGSDAVKSLKRPTTAAWAVNQAARRRQDLVRELLDSGAALRVAQRAALSGSHRADLRDATRRRRAAVASLLDEATAVLEAAGRNAGPHIDEIRSTLEAASADEEIGAVMAAGRLTKETEPPSGLGDVGGFEVLTGGRRGATGPAAAQGRDQPDSPAARRIRQRLDARVAKAEGALAEARARAQEARRDADAAKEDVDRLERELGTARRRAERASKAFASAEAREQEAETALERARADLDSER